MKILKNSQPFNRPSVYSKDNYQLLEIGSGLENIFSEILKLQESVTELRKDFLGTKLKQVSQTPKEYFTIKDVTELFDISPRTQQDERSRERLNYLKKTDGIKILYKKEHLTEYILKYYLPKKY